MTQNPVMLSNYFTEELTQSSLNQFKSLLNATGKIKDMEIKKELFS
jgi:hypothetical protein